MNAQLHDLPDARLAALRAQVAEADRALVEAVNERIELVREVRRCKRRLGIPFVDRAQEQRLVAALAATNDGPLSEPGLRDLIGVVLDLTKREVARAELRLPREPDRDSV